MQKEKVPNNRIQLGFAEFRHDSTISEQARMALAAPSLVRLSKEHTVAFKEEMQEAFQHGFMEYYKDDNQWQVLPDKDFYQSLEAEGAEAYEAVNEDGQRLGGAIITANGNMGEPMEQRALQ